MKTNNPDSVAAARAFLEYLAKSVKEYRQKNKLTVMQLAAMVNISVKKIIRIENSTYDVNTTKLVKLAHVMELQASQLFRAAGL